jgi:hypothetical protein
MGWFPLHNHSHFSLLGRPVQAGADCRADQGVRLPGGGADRPRHHLRLPGLPEGDGEEEAEAHPGVRVLPLPAGRVLADAGEYRPLPPVRAGQEPGRVEEPDAGLLRQLPARGELPQAPPRPRAPRVVLRGRVHHLLRPHGLGPGQRLLQPSQSWPTTPAPTTRPSAMVAPDWKDAGGLAIRPLPGCSASDNFYLEIQLVDHKNLPAALVVARILRHVARKLGMPRWPPPTATIAGGRTPSTSASSSARRWTPP